MINKKFNGFTIIELIVVIAIIAILAAIVMVNVTQYINKSKIVSIQASMRTIQTNATIWIADQEKGNGSYQGGGYFTSDAGFTVPWAAIKKISDNGDTIGLLDKVYCISTVLPDNVDSWCISSSGFAGFGVCQYDSINGTASCE